MIKKDFDKNSIILIFIVGFILLTTPLIISLFRGSEYMLSEESYYHLRIIEQYKDTGIYTQDILLNRNINFNVFYFVLSFFGIPEVVISNIIPAIFGILCMFLFYFLIKNLKLEKDAEVFSLIFLVSSPIFIYTFTTINPESFYALILLLSIFMFFRKSYLTVLLSGILAYVNISYFLVFIVTIFIYMIFKKEFHKKLLFLNFLTGFIIFFFSFISGNNPFLSLGLTNFSFTNLLISLGGVTAYSSITLVLFFIGLFIIWKRDFRLLAFIISSILIFVLSFYLESLRILVIFEIAIFSGISIKTFLTKKWNIAWIKEVVLLIIICSIIFASLVFMRFETTFISEEYVEGYNFLNTADSNDVIFSHYNNGFIIQKLSERKTFWDSYSLNYDIFEEKEIIAETIFHTRDLKVLKKTIEDNNISYILIDDKMVNGLVWNGPEEGVLFLLKNSKDFVKVFDNDSVKIYRFVG